MALKIYFQNSLIFVFQVIILFSACKKEIEPLAQPATKSLNTVLSKKTILSSDSYDDLIAKGSKLKLGINGHLGDAPYLSVPWADQIKMLKERGMSYYRINVQTKDDGTASSHKDLKELQKAAEEADIKLLPMLYLRRLDYNDTEENNYNLGKQIGSRFASKYGNYFDFYNLGNDEELPLLFDNKTGIQPEHYDLVKFKATAAYLKGMD